MKNKKMRIGGVTVESTKTYSGDLVLQLIEISFENGRRRGVNDSEKEFCRGYEAGLIAGEEESGETLKKLREALRDVFK